MAFNSLNTIDKDCVTVASRGRKTSVWRSSDPPKLGGDPNHKGTVTRSVPRVREERRNGVTQIFSAHECCQSVPVLLVSLFLVMNVGVTTCI